MNIFEEQPTHIVRVHLIKINASSWQKWPEEEEIGGRESTGSIYAYVPGAISGDCLAPM